VRFILRRIVYFIAGFFGLMVYQALRPYPFAIDVALCVAFTVEVAGLVITARLMATPPLKPMPSAKTIALTHGGFLLGVVVIERIFPLLQMLFPGGPTTRSGRPGSWALLIEIIAITVLGYSERVWLLRGPKAVKVGVWADTAIGVAAVPAGQVESTPVVGMAMAPTVSTAAVVGTLSPELGSNRAFSGSSAGYTSVTGLFSTTEKGELVARAVPEPVAVQAAFEHTAVMHSANASGYTSITGLVAQGPESEGSAETSRAHRQLASTGDDYEGFLQHMKESKRPFRKPGMTVNEEFQAWLAHRARSGNGGADKKSSGLSRFLMGNSRA
jgi:hypothetical protein